MCWLYKMYIVKRIIDCRCEQKNKTYVQIDGMGYLAENFEKLEDLSEGFLKGKPTRLEVYEVLVAEEDFVDAIESFYDNCPGSSFGEDPAFYIDTSRTIIGINCPRLNCNCRGELICGEEIPRLLTKSGRFGFCFLEVNACQENCKVKQKILEKDYSPEIITVGGKQYTIAEVRVL